jgi:hypothetical protein
VAVRGEPLHIHGGSTQPAVEGRAGCEPVRSSFRLFRDDGRNRSAEATGREYIPAHGRRTPRERRPTRGRTIFEPFPRILQPGLTVLMPCSLGARLLR